MSAVLGFADMNADHKSAPVVLNTTKSGLLPNTIAAGRARLFKTVDPT